MRREFSYLEKDGIYFPVIKVTLRVHDTELTVSALIDSGASFSIFHPEVAEDIGIKIEKGKIIYLTGIGGRILGYLHELKVSVDGQNFFVCKMIFSREFTVSFNLLGRDNFFKPFVISFLEKKRKIILADA